MSGIGLERWLAAAAVILCYALLCCATIYGEYRKRRRRAEEAAALLPASQGARPWLVAYASQTGFAEHLAWRTARMLHTAGAPARIESLAALGAQDLLAAERALFVVSTYGEGDQPDNAAPFARRLMNERLPLNHLHYGVLAVGDRAYANFCGFGRRLDRWLASQGGQALFERVEVNNEDGNALQTWAHRLSHLAGTSDLPDWQAPAYERWRLAARAHLNPDSAGHPCFHIEIEPVEQAALPSWQAGDLVQIRVPEDPERPREYSIASLPMDGRIHLLIRQERRDDGALGAGSGWLTARTPLGSLIELRVRTHSNFHLGENASRPLILIGNGTGMAGLRCHLKARAAVQPTRNWLIFGERNAAHDFYYRDDIERWLQQGVLTRADMVFSRDQPQRLHVQDRLRACAELVREWVADGAALYVCGSLEGMAGGVEAALIEILGAPAVERLTAAGRYRRDVY